MPTVLVTSPDQLEEAIALARAGGLRIVCADRSGTVTVDQADLSGPLLLAVGGARRGLTRRLTATADLVVAIAYGRRFRPALDTTSATAVLAFEVARQRRAAAAFVRGSATASRRTTGTSGRTTGT